MWRIDLYEKLHALPLIMTSAYNVGICILQQQFGRILHVLVCVYLKVVLDFTA